jgi:hypothetical protein
MGVTKTRDEICLRGALWSVLKDSGAHELAIGAVLQKICCVTDLKATYIRPDNMKDFVYCVFPKCEYYRVHNGFDFDAFGKIDNVSRFAILLFEGDGANNRHAVRYVAKGKNDGEFQVIDTTTDKEIDTIVLADKLPTNPAGIWVVIMSKF